jgi:hypothetical protein
MIKYFFGFFVMSLVSIAFAQDVTPLQLKVMQSRKFNKSLQELSEAVKTNMEDSGGSCYPKSVNQYECRFMKGIKGLSGTDFIPIFGTLSRMSDMEKAEKEISRVTFEVDTKDMENGITVRMRMYSGRMADKQITDPQIYSKKYKEIADTLFTNAIPLEAAVQE